MVEFDGSIRIPTVGPVSVVNRTPAEAQTRIIGRTRQATGQPDHWVSLKVVGSIGPVTYSGMVAQAGTVIFREGLKLSEVVSEAKPTEAADRYVQILSASGEILRVELGGSQNPSLQAGDQVIFARRSTNPDIVVVGGVPRPGIVAWETGLTVRQAIDACGGLAPNADPDSIRIVRDGARQEPKSLAILGEQVLRPGDSIEVATRSVRLYVTVQGAVKRPGAVEVRETTRLSEVLPLAGGALPNADLTLVTVRTIRQSRNSTKTYNLRKIKPGTPEDPILNPSDVISVPFRRPNG